jgi:transposase
VHLYQSVYGLTSTTTFIDAEAIAEAVTHENMRFVPTKTDDQLHLQALHRVRNRAGTSSHGGDRPNTRF